MVRQDGGGYTVVLQAKSYLLEEGLGDMESVDIVSLSHNRHRRLGVSFRHGQRALMAVRGVVEAAFGACRQSRKSFRKTLGSYASFCWESLGAQLRVPVSGAAWCDWCRWSGASACLTKYLQRRRRGQQGERLLYGDERASPRRIAGLSKPYPSCALRRAHGVAV
jgi:hypothetical protein